MKRTPNLLLGPFYPLAPCTDASDVLWTAGFARLAHARQVEISGRIHDLGGIPIANVMVEIWQADDLGRYRHPSAPGPAPDDPGFAGYGVCRTNASGEYRFRTLKPGSYVDGGQRRAPHVHFQVTGTHDRLVTQMFFPDEPRNLDDRWYRAASRPQQLVASAGICNPSTLAFSWDIVLTTG